METILIVLVCVAGVLLALAFYYRHSLTEAYANAGQFLKDVRSELRKVTFPSRQETLASTAVVITVVFIISVYLGIVDFGLSVVLSSILRH
jgi:preprotein translocase subunit SecE